MFETGHWVETKMMTVESCGCTSPLVGNWSVTVPAVATAAGLAERVEVQVAYAIGRANPVGLYVETFGTATEGQTDESIQQAVEKVFDLRPEVIIRELDLKRPIYARTAAYGHFGRTDIDVPWERTDKVDDLKAAAGV